MKRFPRYACYFLIASIAFFVGTLVALFLVESGKNERIETIHMETPVGFEQPPEISYPAIVSADQSPKKEFKCTDKVILTVLADIKRDKESERSLERYIKDGDITDCADMFEVRREDLNRNGVNEFIVDGFLFGLCSARSDCPSWVVSVKGGTPRIILDAGRVQSLSSIENYHQGFKTFGSIRTSGGCCHIYAEYRYENGRYNAFKCTQGTHEKGDEILKPLKLRECMAD